jgi:hypothetical protein
MNKSITSSKSALHSNWLVPVWLVAVTLVMAAQLFVEINRYAVNLLYLDQWDAYDTLFREKPFFQSFMAQAGQLRLGVGGWISNVTAIATNWNTRSESFVIGFLMLLVALAAFYLKWRLFSKFVIWDALIALICLSMALTDVPVYAAFPSHSVVPALLLMVFAICLTIKNVKLRFVALAVLNFLTMFTGWGIFIGVLSPIVFSYLFVKYRRVGDGVANRWAGIALVASVLSLLLFVSTNRFSTGVGCFTFPHFPLQDNFRFISKMFSYSVGLRCVNVLSMYVGPLFILAFVVVLLNRIWRLWQAEEYDAESLVISFLISFSILYALATTVGRVCLGDCASNAGRYQPLLIPAWIGLYFGVVAIESRFHVSRIALLILTFCFLTPQWKSARYESSMAYFRTTKTRWKDCYLQKEDVVTCDREAGEGINPPSPSSIEQERLDYLKARHLNLFADK